MTIGALFNEFISAYLPPNAPEAQRKQLEMAFFAGASSALAALHHGDVLASRQVIGVKIEEMRAELQSRVVRAVGATN